MTASPAALILLAGCARIPTALQPDPPAAEAPARETAAPPADLAQAVARVIARDPLARRPAPADLSALAEEPARAALADALATTRSPDAAGVDAIAADLHALEARHPATVAVALARGSRLGAMELRPLRHEALPPGEEAVLLALLAPLDDVARTGPEDVRSPLAWLAPPDRARDAALAAAEQHTLAGWLVDPDLPLGPVADSFVVGVHDRLVAMPVGALVEARGHAADTSGATDPAPAWTDLEAATTLALQGVAADRDAQQAAAREAMTAERRRQEALGRTLPEAHDAPLRRALVEARTGLTAAAADDDAAGGALVALTAERILGGDCGAAPCRGLDRTETLRAAARWGERPAAHASAWRCVAAKQALDTVVVTRQRPTWGVGVDLLVDVLLAEAPGPVDASLLRQARPGPATWLALTRAAGVADATDPDRAIDALATMTAGICQQAADAAPLPDAARAHAARIVAGLTRD